MDLQRNKFNFIEIQSYEKPVTSSAENKAKVPWQKSCYTEIIFFMKESGTARE